MYLHKKEFLDVRYMKVQAQSLACGNPLGMLTSRT